MPMIGSAGQNFYPDPPENSLVHDASALQLYWSSEVRALVHDWTLARNQLAMASATGRAEGV
jgi:hypothetical protein